MRSNREIESIYIATIKEAKEKQKRIWWNRARATTKGGRYSTEWRKRKYGEIREEDAFVCEMNSRGEENAEISLGNDRFDENTFGAARIFFLDGFKRLLGD